MEYVMVLIVASLGAYSIMGLYPDEKTCKAAYEALNVGLVMANPDVEVGCFSMDDVKKAQDEAKKKLEEKKSE